MTLSCACTCTCTLAVIGFNTIFLTYFLFSFYFNPLSYLLISNTLFLFLLLSLFFITNCSPLLILLTISLLFYFSLYCEPEDFSLFLFDNEDVLIRKLLLLLLLIAAVTIETILVTLQLSFLSSLIF